MFPPNMPYGGLYGYGGDAEEGDEQPASRRELSVFSSSSELWAEVKRLREEVDSKARALKSALDAKVTESKPIIVLTGPVSQRDAEQIAQVWAKRHPNGALICLPEDATLKTLTDSELRECGLKRVSYGPATEQELYDEMLKGNI